MKVEQLTIYQLEKIVPLFDAYRQFYEQESDMDAARAFLKARLEKKQSVIFVAQQDDDYIGFTQLYPTFSSVGLKPAYILNDLYVAQQARSQGVAKQLMAVAFQYAQQQNARYISLETAKDNSVAQALYKKMMTEDTEVKHYTRSFI